MSLTDELVHWTHEQKCLKAVESLVKNGFSAVYCPRRRRPVIASSPEAADAASVGFGGSMSIVGLGVESRLREQGKEILNHADLPFPATKEWKSCAAN